LVLLDVRLPDIPGPELARQMREQPEWRDIPIIMVTAQDDPVAPENQPCAITIARATAWQPAEVIRWVQNMVEATVTPPPVFAAPPEGPVL
jgi:CheY-like chemotaxis protein